jgi:hypothetical protein
MGGGASLGASSTTSDVKDIDNIAPAIREAVGGGGCLVMYDDRLLEGCETWWVEQTTSQNRKFVFDALNEEERDHPYDANFSILGVIQTNQRYAEKHGYTFQFRRSYPPFSLNHPPYWIKVKLVRDALYQTTATDAKTGGGGSSSSGSSSSSSSSSNSNGECRYAYESVAWFDTDACVDHYAMETPLQALFAKFTNDRGDPVSILYSGNQPQWEGEFCAGVFIVRNTPIARRFFDDWLSKYDASAWSKTIDGHRWECTGEWAGEKYEQGSGSALLIHPTYAQHTKQMPWYFFNNHNYRRAGRGFSMHFAGVYKYYIEPYLRSFPSLTSHHQKKGTDAATAVVPAIH